MIIEIQLDGIAPLQYLAFVKVFDSDYMEESGLSTAEEVENVSREHQFYEELLAGDATAFFIERNRWIQFVQNKADASCIDLPTYVEFLHRFLGDEENRTRLKYIRVTDILTPADEVSG